MQENIVKEKKFSPKLSLDPQRARIPLNNLAQAYAFDDIIVKVVFAYLNEFLG